MRSARRGSRGNSVERSETAEPVHEAVRCSQLAAPYPPCYGSRGGGQAMTRRFPAILGALAFSAASPALAQAVKIGLILPYSGQFADAATQMDNAIKLYMKENGGTVPGRKLEIVRRGTGCVAPDLTKRHSKEQVVRDTVDIFA